MNFLTDNEILKAHTVARANQVPRTFLNQLTVQDLVFPHHRPPVAYNCCVSVFFQAHAGHNNITTDFVGSAHADTLESRPPADTKAHF